MRRIIVVLAATASLAASAGVHAEEFATKTGRFVKEGASWVEYSAKGGARRATFSELGRTKTVVALFDPSRTMILRLPLAGGMATWTDLDEDQWNGLASVTYTP